MNYPDLLPMELQEELIQLSEAQNRIEFRVGDVVSAASAWNQANERTVPIMEIYHAVGAFVGKASRTVRDYHNVAAFYPPDVREEYTILRFDHFRQAMTLGPNWKKALDWAVEQVDQLGRPASVDAMIAQFTPQPPGEGEGEGDEYGDGDSGEVDDGLLSPVDRIHHAIQTIQEALVEIDLNPADKEQVDEAISVMQEVFVRVGD